MIRWIPYTFVRTVLFFIAGIVIGMEWPDVLPAPWDAVLALAALVVYFIIVFGQHPYIINPGWVALPLIALFGYARAVRHIESRQPNHISQIDAPIRGYRAVVTGFGAEKANSWKMEARVQAVDMRSWCRASGRVLLYLRKTDYPKPFRYGDVLIIRGQPQPPDPPWNPGAFDYRKYLALQNIYHVHFLGKGGAIRTGFDPPSKLMAMAFDARTWAEKTLKRFVHDTRAQAIALALVLGITDGLDSDLLSAYAATGSMHVLAVSGLHISILYLILLRILTPVAKLRKAKWVAPVIGVMAMWMYAFITGLPPSVLRAVTMFSFLALARLWARHSNVFNTLAVSAFCLLLFDPFLVRSVGFQLSYLAVLGIVYLYPRIIILREPKTRIMTEVWKITAVSVSAQAATFAVGLLYFHQFPNLFLLSNLLVVPLSSLVLIFGVGVLGVSFVAPVASVVGFCLEMLIRVLNYIVFTLESIPLGLTDNVYINGWQCALLMLLLMVVLALLHYRKFGYMVAASLIVAVYAGFQWGHFILGVNRNAIAVYRIPGHRAVDLIAPGQAFFLADSSLQRNEQAVRYHISPNRLIAGVGRVHAGCPASRELKGCRLLRWAGKTILCIDDRNFEVPPIAVDLVIVGHNAVWRPEDISERVSFETIVLDSSNSFSFATNFLRAARGQDLDVHSVLHEGAFVSVIENTDS